MFKPRLRNWNRPHGREPNRRDTEVAHVTQKHSLTVVNYPLNHYLYFVQLQRLRPLPVRPDRAAKAVELPGPHHRQTSRRPRYVASNRGDKNPGWRHGDGKRQTVWFVTSLLDKKAYPAIDVVALEAAIFSGEVDPIRISFVHTVRAVLSFSPAFSFEPIGKLPKIYEAMLIEIVSNLVAKRPGRNESRAVRREPKHYPSLKTTRAQ